MKKFLMSLALVLGMVHAANATPILNTVDATYTSGGCCSGGERGYWFVAPVDFTLDTLWLNTASGLSNNFNVDILIFNQTPVEFSASTTNYTTVFTQNNASGAITVDLDVTANMIFGVLAWDNDLHITPYSTAVSQTIFGSNFTLTRLVRQSLINNDPVSSEANSSNVGAIGFSYSALGSQIPTPNAVPAPHAIALLGLGLIGVAARRKRRA